VLKFIKYIIIIKKYNKINEKIKIIRIMYQSITKEEMENDLHLIIGEL
jgi:hypothetical protein